MGAEGKSCAPQREDGHIVIWDEVHGASWPHTWTNRGSFHADGDIRHARIERQYGGSRSAVLKSCKRGLDGSRRR